MAVISSWVEGQAAQACWVEVADGLDEFFLGGERGTREAPLRERERCLELRFFDFFLDSRFDFRVGLAGA